MSKICYGDGRCFESYGPADECGNQYLWKKRKNYKKCPCKLMKCPRCKINVPQFWPDCFKGYCSMQCHMPECFQ